MPLTLRQHVERADKIMSTLGVKSLIPQLGRPGPQRVDFSDKGRDYALSIMIPLEGGDRAGGVGYTADQSKTSGRRDRGWVRTAGFQGRRRSRRGLSISPRRRWKTPSISCRRSQSVTTAGGSWRQSGSLYARKGGTNRWQRFSDSRRGRSRGRSRRK